MFGLHRAVFVTRETAAKRISTDGGVDLGTYLGPYITLGQQSFSGRYVEISSCRLVDWKSRDFDRFDNEISHFLLRQCSTFQC
jgi:hypothetical protein